MKRLILFLTVLIIGVTASALPRPAAAIENWPPLLDCSDVNGDGRVNIIDIGTLVVVFGTSYPSDDYLLLNDVSGDGFVNIIDIGTAVVDFGDICSLTNTQVAQATLATIKYRDPAVAVADGYLQSSQYVPNMGIHMFSPANLMNYPDLNPTACDPDNPIACQIEHPAGLLYTETSPGSGVADEFIGLWYVVPVDSVCTEYGISGPCQATDTQPVGFGETNTDEDNLDADGGGPQRGWHTHTGLCGGKVGTSDAWVIETFNDSNENQQNCLTGQFSPCGVSGCFWFDTYGWMVHLYNFIPNPAGRFQNWSCNITGAVVSC